MNVLIFLSLLICPVICDTHEFTYLFKGFITKYKKNYVDDNEYSSRFHIFKDNLKKQQSFNDLLSNKTIVEARYGVNQFSDLSTEEFEAQYLSTLKSTQPLEPLLQAQAKPAVDKKLPMAVDWRKKNIITGIKNQGSCGGCWAFSAVGAVESMYALKTGTLTTLSSQQVVDCSYGFHNMLYGCKGGDTCTAMLWMQTTKTQLVKLSSYSDRDKAESCKLLPNATGVVTVDKYTCNRFVGNEDGMLEKLATVGPVTVSLDASSWQSYLGGIIRYHCGQKPNNHAVLVVGYDLTGEVPFYIIKNSWGASFGDHGYVYIAVGNNVCGIAERVSTVHV